MCDTLCLLFSACSCCALVSLLYSTSYSCCPLTCLLILLNYTLHLSLPITSVKFLNQLPFTSVCLPLRSHTFYLCPSFYLCYFKFLVFTFTFLLYRFSHIYLHCFLSNIFYIYLPPTSVFLFTCNFLSFFFFRIYFSYFLPHLPPFAFNFSFPNFRSFYKFFTSLYFFLFSTFHFPFSIILHPFFYIL